MLRLPRAPSLRAALSPRSWATAWRGASPGPVRRGPQIAVLGNCQARGVAQAVEVLVPQARVTLLPLVRLRRDYAGTEYFFFYV